MSGTVMSGGNGDAPGRIILVAMAISLKPLADRVVVERAPAPEKTEGGIVLPDTAKDKPAEGTVIAAGPGRVMETGKLRPLEVHEGDKILFGSYAGSEIKVGGKEYLILREEEILAVLSN